MDSPALQPVPATPPRPAGPPVYPLGERLTQSVLAMLVIAFLVILGYRGYDLRFRTRPTDAAIAPLAKLDLNSADRGELELLPGVGPRLATAIDDHRKSRGPFRSVEDLRGVQGIGKATLDKLSPFLTVAPPPPVKEVDSSEPLVLMRKPPPPPVAVAPPAFQPGVQKVSVSDAKININTATVEDLLRLPAIGPTLAQRIVEFRASTPFQRVDDLGKVRGIGMGKTLDKVRPFISVE